VKLIYQAFANLLSWMVLRARSDTATGQRVHRRPDLPSAVHRGNGRGPCPSNIPRPATRADLHLHARSRPRIPDSRAVLHGAAGRIPHGGGGAADRAHPDRRTHRIPHHGRHQISPHPPATPARSHGRETTPNARPTSRWIGLQIINSLLWFVVGWRFARTPAAPGRKSPRRSEPRGPIGGADSAREREAGSAAR